MSSSGAEVTSLVELMDERATRLDSNVLYNYLTTGEQWTFADLPVRAACVAGQLAGAGIAAGERVGVLAEDRAVFCDAFYGLSHLGAIPVPLGLAGRAGSEAWCSVLRDRVDRLGLVALATDRASSSVLGSAVPMLRAIGVDGGRGNPAPAGPVNPVAFIQPSSGTTGHPKGIVISQAAVLANLRSIREQWDLTESDSGLSWLPLFHDMGLIGTVINALHTGGTLHHWPTESFLRSPGRWIGLLDELNVTIAIAPPFALELVTRRWLRRGGVADLSSVRSLLVGAETIRPSVIEAFAEVFEPLGLRRGRAVSDLRPRRSHARGDREAARRTLPHGRRQSAPLGVMRHGHPRRFDPARPPDERAARPDPRGHGWLPRRSRRNGRGVRRCLVAHW